MEKLSNCPEVAPLVDSRGRFWLRQSDSVHFCVLSTPGRTTGQNSVAYSEREGTDKVRGRHLPVSEWEDDGFLPHSCCSVASPEEKGQQWTAELLLKSETC